MLLEQLRLSAGKRRLGKSGTLQLVVEPTETWRMPAVLNGTRTHTDPWQLQGQYELKEGRMRNTNKNQLILNLVLR
jgi:hypothetical protein